MREDYYWYWVNNIVGMSNAKLKKLFAVFDTPEEIYKASDRLLESVNDIRMSDIMAIKESRKDDYIYRQYSDIEKQGIRFTYPGQINIRISCLIYMIIHIFCIIKEDCRTQISRQLLLLERVTALNMEG